MSADDGAGHPDTPAAEPVRAPLRTGDGPSDELAHATAEKVLRLIHDECRGLFGYYLLRALGLAYGPPTKSQREAAPDSFEGK